MAEVEALIMTDSELLSLNISPIGYLRSSDRVKFSVPRQPDEGVRQNHIISLLPGRNFEAALRDLEGFDRIWLIWWFHKNSSWRPCVMPPRGDAKRRGVFSTRSPHRPNPLGISNVQLLKIEGRTLIIGDSDLIDGTPIFDIKPYIPKIDAYPDAAAGWVSNLGEEGLSSYTVNVGELAQRQLQWLNNRWQIDFFSRAKDLLERDPSPHRTRRIVCQKDGGFRMGCGAWRIYFELKGSSVLVTHLAPGYPERVLTSESYDRVPDREAQLEFSRVIF